MAAHGGEHAGVGDSLWFHPAVGDLALREEIFQSMGLRGPAGTHDTDSIEGFGIGGLPFFEKILQDRVEVFFGRAPTASSDSD